MVRLCLLVSPPVSYLTQEGVELIPAQYGVTAGVATLCLRRRWVVSGDVLASALQFLPPSWWPPRSLLLPFQPSFSNTSSYSCLSLTQAKPSLLGSISPISSPPPNALAQCCHSLGCSPSGACTDLCCLMRTVSGNCGAPHAARFWCAHAGTAKQQPPAPKGSVTNSPGSETRPRGFGVRCGRWQGPHPGFPLGTGQCCVVGILLKQRLQTLPSPLPMWAPCSSSPGITGGCSATLSASRNWPGLTAHEPHCHVPLRSQSVAVSKGRDAQGHQSHMSHAGAHLGTRGSGGTRQARWKARGQPSQQMSSPPSPHTAHSSSFSCHGGAGRGALPPWVAPGDAVTHCLLDASSLGTCPANT